MVAGVVPAGAGGRRIPARGVTAGIAKLTP